MQRVVFSYLFAFSLGVTGAFAVPQLPSPSSITPCERQCIHQGYPEFVRDNGCPDDPTFIKCICRRPDALFTIKGCVLSNCSGDPSINQLIPFLDPRVICNATIPSPSSITPCEGQCFHQSYPEFVTDNGCPDDPTYIKCLCRRPYALPIVKRCILSNCSSDSSIKQLTPWLDPSVICVGNSTTTITSASVTSPPTVTTPLPTGAPTPGGNTTVTTPKHTTATTASTTSVPPSSNDVSGGMEFNAVMAGLVGIVGIFVGL